MTGPLIVLISWLWFHRLFVHGGVKDLLDQRGGTSPLTTWGVVIETLSMASLSVVGLWMQWHPFRWDVFAAGNVLMILACGVGWWSRRTLGRHFSIHLTTDHGHELVTSGPYRWVRHPVYTGDLLFHVAVPLLACTYEALLFAPVYFLLVRSRMKTEEQMLSQEYADYPTYMQQTKRLIPGVY